MIKLQRYLPFIAVFLCIPGTALCTLHWLHGFDFGTGLPSRESHTFLYCILFFAACAVLYAVCSLPTRKLREVAYEDLMCVDSIATKASMVTFVLLLAIEGVLYFVTMRLNTSAVSSTSWMEYLYVATIFGAAVGLLQMARNLNSQLTKKTAYFWTLPFLFACVHLLVEYRLTCTDPKLTAFALSLIGSICMVFGYYYLARLLFGKPLPERFSFFSALAFTISASNICGYLLARYTGMRSIELEPKTLLRATILAIGCGALLVHLISLSRNTIKAPVIETEGDAV